MSNYPLDVDATASSALKLDKPGRNRHISPLSSVKNYGSHILANSPQARKRARQAEVRRQRNVGQRSTVRTAIKKTLKAIEAGDKSAAQEGFKSVVVLTDRSAGKGLMHANKAARIKSRINQKIKALG